MGKPLVEARGDVQEAVDMAYHVGGEGRRSFGQTVPSELPDKFAMSLREPVGVVAAITPWNFPIALPSWKILPALVLGNTVVWKPSSETPVCATKFAELSAEAGLLAGVLNLVLGHDIVLPAGCPRLAAELAARGYRCHAVPMSEFIKAGGACKCLTLFLPQR